MWRYRWQGQILCVIFCCAVSTAANAVVSATHEGDKIVLQNSVLKLVIELNRGGQISEYLYKPFEQNLTDLEWGGFLIDHVWEQTWPGEFMNRKYEGEIVKAGPEEAVVRVWTMGQGDSVKGIRLERVMTLGDDDRAIRCAVSLINTSDEGRVTGYWAQSVFWFQSTQEGMRWHQPTMRGIAHEGWFVDDFTAGWIGTTSSKLPGGIIFVMDYNDLFRLYPNSWSVTTEWMYDKVAIPPGKTWSTQFAVIPVKGITGFGHGSVNLVANLEVQQIPGGLQITHQLTKGLWTLKDVTAHTKVWGLRQPWTATVPDAVFAELTEAVQTATLRASGVESMPVGIEVTVTGTTPDGRQVTEKYGDYFGGDYGANINLADLQPLLTFPRPPKNKVFLKPDVIQYVPNPHPRVLFFRGLFNRFFRVDEAIKSAFPEATVVDAWLDASDVGLLFSYFPADYPTLLSYDLIVLANVPAKPLDLLGEEMLKDYLQAGGNVLVLGGDQSFGQAVFANQELIAQFPLELGGAYNWRKIPGGGALRVVADLPLTKGVSFSGRDMVYYSHLCRPKEDATVAVTAGERPILVLRTLPTGGRIACVLATPFGEAAEGEVAFWDTPAWKALMGNTVRWLVQHG